MPEPKARRRSGGPPTRADDQSGSTTAFAAAIACELPGVASGGGSFSAAGTVFLELLGADCAELLLDPFHRDRFRVTLNRTARDELRELIRRAWSNVAPARSKAALKARLRRRRPPLTIADIREVVERLPGVSLRVKERPTGETLMWEANKTMFVKFGEAGNLLPPDVMDTLMIRRCPDRPSLLATSPDRFFITHHYGDPSESGAVLTRLSENTSQHLVELEELIIESWRDVAPKRMVAAFEASATRE